MRYEALFVVMLGLMVSASSGQTPQSLDALIEKELPSLVATYQSLHAAPELSRKEEKTSALLATQLRSLGFEVSEHVGKYHDPAAKGYGIVAVLPAFSCHR